MTTHLPFSKGHGTQNDFVLILDPDELVELDAARVARLADRRAGIGGDGVIRAARRDGQWFMDYRNADGSIAQMCGNGVRAFAEFLRYKGEVSPAELITGVTVGTRAGDKVVTRRENGWYAVDMGPWMLVGGDQAVRTGSDSTVRSARSETEVPALSVDMGNPHTVVVLPGLEDLARLDLTEPPVVTPQPPEGTNVEFVVVHEVLADGRGHLSMRVFERGVGETRSCGTGACAAMLAAWTWSGQEGPTRWRVDVPGGELEISLLPNGQVELAGPAEIVADGSTTL